MPSYGSTAKIRQGSKPPLQSNDSAAMALGAADHDFMASSSREGCWASWLHIAVPLPADSAPRWNFCVPETCLWPWEVAEQRECHGPWEQQGGTPPKQTTHISHSEKLHVPGRALHRQAKPYVDEPGAPLIGLKSGLVAPLSKLTVGPAQADISGTSVSKPALCSVCPHLSKPIAQVLSQGRGSAGMEV